jgi:hypothetical protein
VLLKGHSDIRHQINVSKIADKTGTKRNSLETHLAAIRRRQQLTQLSTTTSTPATTSLTTIGCQPQRKELPSSRRSHEKPVCSNSDIDEETVTESEDECDAQDPPTNSPGVAGGFAALQHGGAGFGDLAGANQPKRGTQDHHIIMTQALWDIIVELHPNISTTTSAPPDLLQSSTDDVMVSMSHSNAQMLLNLYPDFFEQGQEDGATPLSEECEIMGPSDYKKIQGLELSERKEVEPTSAAEDAFHRSPPQSCDQRCPEDSKASLPHCYSRSLSPDAIELESSVPPHVKFKSTNAKRSREESAEELFNPAPDEHDLRVTKGDESPPPLKRQCHALEQQVGESLTQARVGHSNWNANIARARGSILMEISSAALDKLLELHPDIFDLDLGRRTTPAPPSRQAMGPPNKPTSRESMERTGYHREATAKALASEDNIFGELKTTRSTSLQFELQQMERRNRLLAEELAALQSQKKKRKEGMGQMEKDCANCHKRETPEWRRGPSGNRDLCNSCGLRWANQVGRKTGGSTS